MGGDSHEKLMIIFLYGSDGYRLMQYKEELISRYKAKHTSGINLFTFDFAEGDLTGLKSAIQSASFFNEHKLVVCSNIFQNKNVSETVEELIGTYKLDDLADITFLVAETLPEKELSAKSRTLFKLLTGKKTIIFEPLEGARLAGWVKEEFKSRNCTINSSALNLFIESTGKDSWALINEIEKLSAYRNGKEITADDIGLLVSSTEELNIFDFVDAVGMRNRSKAAQLLYLNLATGKDPYFLLSLITGQIRNLISVKDLAEKNESQASIVKKTGLHPFVVKKACQNIGKYQMADLKEKYRNILALELNFKKGRSDITDSLYSLILS